MFKRIFFKILARDNYIFTAKEFYTALNEVVKQWIELGEIDNKVDAIILKDFAIEVIEQIEARQRFKND